MAKAIQFTETGPIESVLRLATVPKPKPSAETSIISIKASAITPADCKAVEGSFPGTTFPRTPGHDYGRIVVAGSKVGKKVWGTGGTYGIDRNGSHAQFVQIYFSSF